MLTPLGKRCGNCESIAAGYCGIWHKGIDVASSFLSAVETGKKSPPDSIIEKISAWGNLSVEEETETFPGVLCFGAGI